MHPDFEARECFLILFLKEISRRLSGRPFAVKGGICLRFFYQSPRLSEDMDFDIAQVPASTLSNLIGKILNSQSFRTTLENKRLILLKWVASKQTATTQRWKITLLADNRSLFTKLEFSRRKVEIPFISGIPDSQLLSFYKIITFVTQYYPIEEMIKQKIMALGHPQREAARDIFDLYYLISQKIEKEIKMPKKIITEAIEKCQTINLTTFKTQVIPFLPEDLASFFMDLDNYKKLKNQVDGCLKGWLGK